MNDVDTTVNEIFELYQKFGSADYIGEPVSQIEHMSQCAALAIAEGYDDEVVLAAFFHDIGHLCVMLNPERMGKLGVKNHERVGSEYLRNKGFPDRITKLVEYHVQAKRYLTHKFSSYFNSLSDASKDTLALQGGPMSASEAQEFEFNPLFSLSIRMRQWDDMAKEVDLPLLNLDMLKKKVLTLLQSKKVNESPL